MVIEREGGKVIEDPSSEVIERELRKLRTYGSSTFASITASDGSYLQVAGGGVTAMLEKSDCHQRHFRAWQDNPVVPPEFDGSALVFSAGNVHLGRHEWFRIDQVIEAFKAFNAGKDLPAFIKWRDISEMFADEG
jgi:hypothetical protein